MKQFVQNQKLKERTKKNKHQGEHIMENIPAGSVAPNTDEKLLSDTNVFDDGAAAAPLKPAKEKCN